jgi:hypothetical protein
LLTDIQRDFVSLTSLVVTVVGLFYAIVQIRKTKSAAEAAKKALMESQGNFHRYIAGNAQRFLGEARIHIDNKEWGKAAVRISDVADQVAQFLSSDAANAQDVVKLRDWAANCRRLASGELTKFAILKWESFSVNIQAKIDSWHGPFRGIVTEAAHDDSEG